MNSSFSSLSIKKNFLASWQMQYKMLACMAASLETPPSACWDLSLSLSMSFCWTYLHGSQPGNPTGSLLSSSSWRFPTSRRQSMVSARGQRCRHHLQFLFSFLLFTILTYSIHCFSEISGVVVQDCFKKLFHVSSAPHTLSSFHFFEIFDLVLVNFGRIFRYDCSFTTLLLEELAMPSFPQLTLSERNLHQSMRKNLQQSLPWVFYFFSGSVPVDQTDICSVLYCTGLDSLMLSCLCGFKPVPVKCKKVQKYGYVRGWKAEPTCFCTQSHPTVAHHWSPSSLSPSLSSLLSAS